MRVRASTGYFIHQALGAALCKQERAGEHRGEAAVARRRCRSQRRGTGMLVHEHVLVHISIRMYVYGMIVFQPVSISPSVYKVSLKTTLELSINKESGSSLYAVCEMRAASSSQTEIASTPTKTCLTQISFCVSCGF